MKTLLAEEKDDDTIAIDSVITQSVNGPMDFQAEYKSKTQLYPTCNRLNENTKGSKVKGYEIYLKSLKARSLDSSWDKTAWEIRNNLYRVAYLSGSNCR